MKTMSSKRPSSSRKSDDEFSLENAQSYSDISCNSKKVLPVSELRSVLSRFLLHQVRNLCNRQKCGSPTIRVLARSVTTLSHKIIFKVGKLKCLNLFLLIIYSPDYFIYFIYDTGLLISIVELLREY
jgi:hypothetical protein